MLYSLFLISPPARSPHAASTNPQEERLWDGTRGTRNYTVRSHHSVIDQLDRRERNKTSTGRCTFRGRMELRYNREVFLAAFQQRVR